MSCLQIQNDTNVFLTLPTFGECKSGQVLLLQASSSSLDFDSLWTKDLISGRPYVFLMCIYFKNQDQGHSEYIVIASPVSRSQLSIVWLWLWVRCWVCPLFVRLPVCPLPFSQSTFHLCAVGCKSSWKWCSVSTSELLPACIHVRLCCSWFCFPPPHQPLSPVQLSGVFRTYIGVEEGGGRGASIISHWPWDSGPEAISKQFDWKDSWRGEQQQGQWVSLSLFPFLCLSPSLSITLFAHSVHVTVSTHHLIWEKLWAVAAEIPLRLFAQWLPFIDVDRISNWDRQEKKNLSGWNQLSMKWCKRNDGMSRTFSVPPPSLLKSGSLW